MHLSRPRYWPRFPRVNVKNILKAVIAIPCLLYLLLRLQSTPSVRQLLFNEDLRFGFPEPNDPTYHPKISLVGVWTGTEAPNYLTWFLESIARQPDEVELVVVQRGRNLGNLAGTIASLGARNIKVVQMTDDRCRHDPQSYSLSILRGEVFADFIHAGAEWWGWCDFDTVIGSLKRKFPWDIAQDYDVLLPAHRNTAAERLLFMRGHLTFFRNTPRSSHAITGHPDFETKEGWLSMREFHDKQACRKHKTLGCSPKEASYSSYIVNNPAINFLAFDALPMKHYLAMTRVGTYSLSQGLEDKKRVELIADRILIDQQAHPEPPPHRPTFSGAGKVRDITLIQGNYSGPLWFHPQYATHYLPLSGDPDTAFRNDDYLTYVYRLDGQTRERLEPVEKVPGKPDGIEEWLYLHWQEEKKKEWFLEIPRNVTGTEDWVLLTQGHEKGGFWKLTVDDKGDRIFVEQ